MSMTFIRVCVCDMFWPLFLWIKNNYLNNRWQPSLEKYMKYLISGSHEHNVLMHCFQRKCALPHSLYSGMLNVGITYLFLATNIKPHTQCSSDKLSKCSDEFMIKVAHHFYNGRYFSSYIFSIKIDICLLSGGALLISEKLI